ncbi:armadillo-like helical domain-containing protein 4 isoform X1 [Molossus molossus]|uniref:Armadillo like helical domain containing 4 n=1 Tax=Molossus molossus TaxID=27622 RepID=A0A7J8JQK5_MOLMO|nr:armadillo-like helical domain-containing protein 4 isoform X1 [Molossus molossus]KAF6499058.1 armadillo like helical domain containing 4 [Molossus molossus]
MRRPVVLHMCLALCSLLLLDCATQCLAFPQMERREIAHVQETTGQPESISMDYLENNSITSKDTPQPVVSEDPMGVLAGPSAMPLNKVFPINKETHSMGAGLMQPNSPGLDTATEPVGRAGDDMFGSSHPDRQSPESLLSKAMVTNPITAAASWNIDEGEPFSSTNTQPIVDGTTETTQGFLKYVDNELFTTESQGGVSLGHSPSSYVDANKILTTDPRTEEFEADTDRRTTSFPAVEPIVGTEPGSLVSGREKPLQMTADNTQATAPKHGLATSVDGLDAEPETDSLMGVPQVTASISTAGPDASVVSDEWDDTKLESVNQIKTPELGDNTETQMRMETSATAQVTDSSVEGMDGDGPLLTEAAHMGLELPEGETHTETALLIARGDGRSSAFTDQISFTPTSLTEDMEVSIVNMLQDTADSVESTKENNAMFSLETTVPISEYESEAHQPLRNTLKDTISQEMRTAAPEAEATVSLVTPELQVSPLPVSRANGEAEEGKEPPAATSASGATQLSRRQEPLATPVSTTAVPLSFEVTPTVEDLMDTVTGPKELFTPVLGSPVTPPGITEEAPSISPALSDSEASSVRTLAPSISRVNTAASYGLDQLESEEGEEDEDEEDEEEEDEEEEDEEEDEEDKDADSLDESLDGDAELRGFTLPGVTSQEPGLEQENVDLLEGATYQVPDAMEWEQQNQGLVRSWMEKLKDKAGYMSGMLAPVGVGIAGALFILGAFYSIKVMNRRRRNGFKRHKRKQREFNSMQDRVMLLADSSEDEF